MILIKKQKDSKYYDSSKKTYITTKDILDYVVKNQDIRIINHLNKDITDEAVVVSYLKNPTLGKITKEDIKSKLQSQPNEEELRLRNCAFKIAKQTIFCIAMKEMKEIWTIGNMDEASRVMEENINLIRRIGNLK